MITRSRLFLIFLLLLAVALTFFQVPLASSQGITLAAARVSGELPVTDPNASLWQQATAIDVPLSAQTVIKPILRETRIKFLTVRALHNGKQIALMLEWEDSSKNDEVIRIQDFTDAVAVQFPQVVGQSTMPFFCMGQQGVNVNIWHWKADWQADIDSRRDMETLYPNIYVDYYPFADRAAGLAAAPGTYSDLNYLPALVSGNQFASGKRITPVEDLVAGGFGSLTAESAEGQNVQGYGVWTNGKWRVIFSRDLTSLEADDITFAPGKVYSVAFAGWDGANNERNGQKSTSQWVSLKVESVARFDWGGLRVPIMLSLFVFSILAAIGIIVYFNRLKEI